MRRQWILRTLRRPWALRAALFVKSRRAALRHGFATALGRSGGFYLAQPGTCNCCDRAVTFFADDAWLRDHFLCPRCGSLPRNRALMACIERHVPDWQACAIHESSPGRRGASVKLQAKCAGYVGTHYFADFPLGQRHPSGWRNENLEAQTFADNSFDLVVTQDVMEHILTPAKAFAEIARTLKPGGCHIFTVPIVRKHDPSRVRAVVNQAGDIAHLHPPEYHGNPIDAAGSLVATDWGYDICDFIRRHSGLDTTIECLDDPARGMRAEYLDVLISRKPSDR